VKADQNTTTWKNARRRREKGRGRLRNVEGRPPPCAGPFTKFEDADKRARASIADETLTALEVHAALEEELVYPAVAEVIDDEELINEAKEEHHVAKVLIKELRKMDAEDEGFSTKFKVLGELVGHHIEEEEGEMFPQAQEGGFEPESISDEVSKRKAKLMQKYEGGKKSSGSRRKKAA
jgi:hypothetical protein